MKRPIYIIFLLGCSFAFAQPPVERNGVTNSIQAESMSKEAAAEAGHQAVGATSTFNEFLLIYNQANSSSAQKNPSKMQQNQMNSYIHQMYLEDSDGFDYNLSTFIAGNYDLSKKPYLDKAKSIQPKNQYVLLQSAGISYLSGDEKTLASDLKELTLQNKWNTDDFSYARDVLTSIPANGILVTHGIDDTYPLLHLQLNEKYRKDVQVIAMHLLQSKDYRDRLIQKKFTLPEAGIINKQFINNFCILNEQSGIYLALTIPRDYFPELEQNLYPVGLAFRYSQTTVENSKSNNALWGKLNKSVISSGRTKNGKLLSGNYLPLLVNLYKYYESENNSHQLNAVRNTIRQVGANIGKANLLTDLGLK